MTGEKLPLEPLESAVHAMKFHQQEKKEDTESVIAWQVNTDPTVSSL